MADVKVTLKRVIDAEGNTDNIHPTTDWEQVENKPSTFTPTAHTLNSHTDVDASPTADGQVLTWDADNSKWIASTTAGGGVSKADLQNVYVYGKADGAITIGQAVQFAGAQGGHTLIKAAVPSEINAEPTLMIGISETTLSNNEFGYVIVNGRLNLDTSDYDAGDLLYFASAGSTAGALTTTEPTDPNASIQMAAVSIDGVGNGEFIIRNTILTRQINEVIGLQGALDSKVNKSGDTMSGNLRIESGSFASLTLDREGDTTTSNVIQFENNNGIVGGVGGFGNDGLQFRTKDGTQMVIDASNNVGIGTESPLHKLEVGDLVSDSTLGTLAVKSDSSDYAILIEETGAGQESWGIGVDVSGDLNFYNSGSATPLVVFNDDNNVGIGTTGPDAKLEVASSSSGSALVGLFTNTTNAGGTSAAIQLRNASDTSVCAVELSANRVGANAGSDFVIKNSNSSPGTLVETFRITEAGNVGIGTSTPVSTSKVTITQQDGNGSQLRLSNTATGGNDWVVGVGSNSSTASIVKPGSLFFYDTDSSTTRLMLDTNGNVGIGTASPGKKLEVNGTTYANLTGGGDSFLANNTANYTVLKSDFNGARSWQIDNVGGKVQWYMDGSADQYLFNMTTDGKVGIGTTSPGYKLDVSGNTQINGGTGVATTGVLVVRQNGDTANNGISLTSSNAASHRVWKDSDGKLNIGPSSNASALVQDLNGNVGIGTTDPLGKLHIQQGSGQFTAVLGADVTNGGLTNSTRKFTRIGMPHYTNSQAPVSLITGDSDGTNNYVFIGGGTSSGNAATAIEFLTAGDTVSTSGTVRMHIASDGDVGIGTTSPGQKLHVVGDTRIEGDLTVNGTMTVVDTDVNTTEQWIITNDGTGPAAIINQTGAQPVIDIQDDGVSAFYIEDGGNVGIGTTNPGYKLQVNGNFNATDPMINSASAANDVSVMQWRYSTSDAYRLRLKQTVTSGVVRWNFSQTNNNTDYNDVLVLDRGNVGIGTTSPGQKLDVNGNIKVSGDNRYMTFGTPGAGSTTGARFISIEGNSDGNGEGSGRIFFTEHNSSTAQMDNFGMSIGYRGGDTSIVGASGNTWTGLTQIGNGQWGMWGHNDSAEGALIMYGDRAGSFVNFADGYIDGISNIYLNEYIYHAGDTNTYIRFVGSDDMQLVAGGRQMLRMDEGTDPDRLRFVTDSDWTDSSGNWNMSGNVSVGGTLTIDTGGSENALVIRGTAPTINLLDDDSGADDFYIHVNSNNFYILRDTAGENLVGTGWDSPHPLQLESDTNIGYLFGSRMFADNYHPNADKWTTARTITLSGDASGSVSLDGSEDVTLSVAVTNDSHDHDGRYFTESEMRTFFNRGYIDRFIGTNLAVGWYTIATNTGDRALGQFQIWDTASSDHQSVVFNASHHFGTDTSNDITVLANSRYSGTNFRYIRIKENDTYNGAALQVYIDDSSNSVSAAIVGYNAQESGWVLKNWVADATDPGDLDGYSSMTSKTEVDLDLTTNGGLMTTGQIYAASNQIVWHSGNDGTGSGLSADNLQGYVPNENAAANSIAKRDGDGDLTVTDLYAAEVYLNDRVYHRGDENTYIQFHNEDQFRVVTGGTERLEVNNSDTKLATNLQIDSHAINMDLNDINDNAIELREVRSNTWPFEFVTNGGGNANESGFWVGSNGYPDMRLRRNDGTVRALISSWEQSYVSNGFSVSGGNLNVTETIASTKNGITLQMDGGGSAEGIRLQADSSTTYPTFLRSVNPSGGGETSAWLFKEASAPWGIWHNNPINSFDITRATVSGGVASNVGGGTNTVMIRLRAETGEGFFAGNLYANVNKRVAVSGGSLTYTLLGNISLTTGTDTLNISPSNGLNSIVVIEAEVFAQGAVATWTGPLGEIGTSATYKSNLWSTTRYTDYYRNSAGTQIYFTATGTNNVYRARVYELKVA